MEDFSAEIQRLKVSLVLKVLLVRLYRYSVLVMRRALAGGTAESMKERHNKC